MPCVFCGAPKTSSEHIFRKKFRQLVPPGSQQRHHVMFDVDSDNQEHVKSKWSGAIFEMTSNCACRDCNHGWMEQLEEQAWPLLKSMYQGQRRNLDADAQTLLATWAAKTAIVFAAKHQDMGVPDSHAPALFADPTRPPDYTQVWLGAWLAEKGQEVGYRHSAIALDRDDCPSSETPDAYDTTFGLGQVVFKVLGHQTSHHPLVRLDRIEPGVLMPIWPISAQKRSWPPAGGSMAFGDPEQISARYNAPLLKE